jgi:hypothetical protein
MGILFLHAYWKLIVFDRFIRREDFAGLYKKVRQATAPATPTRGYDMRKICYAIDLASIWYFKPVLCLQRSAATAELLKQSGIPAELVIGAQQTPFRAHAWVEMAGEVVNDKPYMAEMYQILDRC